jgi:SPP1 gp7 family putative phage head morphogenesis protein
LAEYEPLLHRVLSDAMVLSWMRAAQSVAPTPSPQVEGTDQPPPFSPDGPTWTATPSGDPDVRLPVIEAAVRDLQARRVLTEPEVRALEQDARRGAFTVARIASEETIERVRQAVEDATATGVTLREFRQAVDEAVQTGPLGPAHVETVFRTNIMQAYSAGLLDVLDTPLVGDEFPYLEYVAVHDSRARPEHLAMERHGLDGTNVYRKDDPVIRRFMPPWGYNCRCAIIPATVEDAARAGVREAREWLRTGRPPAQPQFVQPPPFDLPPGWQGAGRIGGVL